LCAGLVARGHDVVGTTRGDAPPIPGAALHPIGTIGPQTDWSDLLGGVAAVVHLASRAHAPASEAARVRERVAAAALARACAAQGVARLVQVSSLRTMGMTTAPGTPFHAGDPPRPADPYGRAKLATERAVQEAAAEGGLDLAILRPPLVYGPGVKGNFRALLQLVASGVPLPFAAIANRRSMIFLDNLVDLIARAALDLAAAGKVLLARDADLSTPELVRALAQGLHRRARLFALPQAVFTALRPVPGFGPPLARLTLSLEADDSVTRAALGWEPPVPAGTGLAITARAFREGR